MKIQPIGDKVVVKLNPVQETTSSGVFIPLNQQSEQQGTVVSIGNRVKFCKVGDNVQKFFSVEGAPYEEDGIEYVIFREGMDIEFVNQKLI